MSAKTKTRRVSILLPADLGERAAYTAKNSGRSVEDFLSDLVMCAMEDLPEIEDKGAERVESVLGYAMARNVTAYEKAKALFADIIEEVTMGPVVEARKAQGLERLPSERSENAQRPRLSMPEVSPGGRES